MKKLLFTLGTVATVVAPVAAVISCGTEPSEPSAPEVVIPKDDASIKAFNDEVAKSGYKITFASDSIIGKRIFGEGTTFTTYTNGTNKIVVATPKEPTTIPTITKSATVDADDKDRIMVDNNNKHMVYYKVETPYVSGETHPHIYQGFSGITKDVLNNAIGFISFGTHLEAKDEKDTPVEKTFIKEFTISKDAQGAAFTADLSGPDLNLVKDTIEKI